MAKYIIGDIQGCFDELQRLLDRINFEPVNDIIWIAGDIINRGPKSLESLRFVKELGKSANSVLGNHDLHVIASAYAAKPDKTLKDDIKRLLDAPDSEELLYWLRTRPLLHHDTKNNIVLTHAGIYPLWNLEKAKDLAKEVEKILQADDCHEFLLDMYGNKPGTWDDSLKGNDRYRFIINAFTRMRYCDQQARLLFDYKGHPDKKPDGQIPWFELPQQIADDIQLIFGHWSALGFQDHKNITGLDTGCLWGGGLTAIRVDHPEKPIYTIPCKAYSIPKELIEKTR